jgi:hypothetical protein
MRFSIRTIWCVGFILSGAILAAPAFSRASAAEQSCRKTIGDKKAELLALECLKVETSIHAPCNAVNPCPVIEGSIEFGCKMLRDWHINNLTEREEQRMKPPKFCAKYLAGP